MCSGVIHTADKALIALELVAIACAILALIVVPAWLLTDGSRLARDIRNGVYHRTAGPVTPHDRGIRGEAVGFLVADVYFKVGQYSGVARAVRNVPWAVIDYTPSRMIIFEVRNRGGEILYVREGYRRPEPQQPLARLVSSHFKKPHSKLGWLFVLLPFFGYSLVFESWWVSIIFSTIVLSASVLLAPRRHYFSRRSGPKNAGRAHSISVKEMKDAS